MGDPSRDGFELQHGGQETLGRLLELLMRRYEQNDDRIGRRGFKVETTGCGVIEQWRLCAVAQQVGTEAQLCVMYSAKHCRG